MALSKRLGVRLFGLPGNWREQFCPKVRLKLIVVKQNLHLHKDLILLKNISVKKAEMFLLLYFVKGGPLSLGG